MKKIYYVIYYIISDVFNRSIWYFDNIDKFLIFINKICYSTNSVILGVGYNFGDFRKEFKNGFKS